VTGPGDRAPSVRCLALDGALADLVSHHAAAAADATGLDRLVRAVTVCADDLPDADDGWLSFSPGRGDDPRPGLVLFFAPGILADPRRRPVAPARAVWELGHPAAEPAPGPDGLAPAEADAFLHHQFTLAVDLLAGRLQPDLVPPGLAEAFTAAWGVTVDGRLARAGLPGYDQARCRGRFSRLFATAGVLMPGHWQIFQSLWDGGLAAQGEVLGAVRRLPRL